MDVLATKVRNYNVATIEDIMNMTKYRNALIDFMLYCTVHSPTRTALMQEIRNCEAWIKYTKIHLPNTNF